MKLRLSSRQSALAQAQSFQVGEALEQAHPGLEIEYLFRESLGDKNLTDPLWKMPEKGVFTEDFFQDLVQNKTDLVVHSWKDLPTLFKTETKLIATLPRADQRDLLLFKKTALKKKNLVLFSSSPRRALNIKTFLNSALPWSVEEIEFQSVRGNIQTRIQKLMDADGVDGLVVAKAAIDRLLIKERFPEIEFQIRKSLEKLNWMLLPLTENPNAAAQGAIAIEISATRPDIAKVIEKINCSSTFATAQREREILQQYGGGCHLALGMSVLDRSFGRIEIVKGLTPSGDSVDSKKFYPTKKIRKDLRIGRLDFSTQREDLNSDLKNKVPFDFKIEAAFVAKAEAYIPEAKAQYVWAAGIQTWKKLAAQGVWVHGSSEGLGEVEDPQIELLAGKSLQWVRLTHEDANQSSTADEKTAMINRGTYKLTLELKTNDLDDSEAFRWKSGSEFLVALQKFPQLRERLHLCGPGRTYEIIRRQLGSDQNIYVELNDEFITVI